MKETETAARARFQAQADSTRAGAGQVRVIASDLAPLWFVRYRMRLVPRAPLMLPLYGRGAILRGAFGVTLRELVCHDMNLQCRACPLCWQCPYPNTFEPAPPEGGDRLSNFSDIPRPFVFDPPTDERAEFRPGEIVEFGLTAVGRASRLSPYFVTAFRKLADDGLGPCRARFDLVEVVALGSGGGEKESVQRHDESAIYKNTEASLSTDAPALRANDFSRPLDEGLTRLTLRFTTPVDLRDQGLPVLVPQFGPLIRRLRDRASSLSVFFGEGPLQIDFKGVSALADGVRLVENRTRMLSVSRHSSKTR